MAAGSVSLDVGNLRKLQADLAVFEKSKVQVGIFSDHDARADSKPTALGNAEIGTIQEFGSIKRNIPERSFLRVPLMDYLPDAIKATGATPWRASILKEGAVATLNRLGWVARNVVQDAFASGGFGMWAANHPRTIREKGSSQPLIATAKMRQSISHRVIT